MLDSEVTLCGEIRCWSLLRVKGLKWQERDNKQTNNKISQKDIRLGNSELVGEGGGGGACNEGGTSALSTSQSLILFLVTKCSPEF